MKTNLPQKVTSVAEAKVLLAELFLNGESFHPEDDASQLTGDIFTKEEGDKLNELMEQIYNLDGNNGNHANPKWDPAAYLNELDETAMPVAVKEAFTLIGESLIDGKVENRAEFSKVQKRLAKFC